MRASDLLGREVFDAQGRKVGICFDVRCLIEEGSEGDRPKLRIGAVLVSPRRAGALLGYERGHTKGPGVLAALVGWFHRGSVMILWDDVAEHSTDGPVVLREGARHHPLG